MSLNSTLVWQLPIIEPKSIDSKVFLGNGNVHWTTHMLMMMNSVSEFRNDLCSDICSLVRELGIYLDSDASMKTHVSKTVSSCFAVLRQIRSIRRSVTQQVVQTLVASLVLTRLDYGNATLAGLPTTQLDRLQSVMNAAARLVCSARKFEHITPLLRDLHWLRPCGFLRGSNLSSLCSPSAACTVRLCRTSRVSCTVWRISSRNDD